MQHRSSPHGSPVARKQLAFGFHCAAASGRADASSAATAAEQAERDAEAARRAAADARSQAEAAAVLTRPPSER